MAGILDLIQSEDPAIQNGLLNFGLSLLRSKGNFGNAVGQAGVAGQLGARDYRQQEALLKRTGLTDQLLQMQVQQAQQQAEQQRKLQELATQYSRSPQQQAMAQNGGPTVAAANAVPNTAPGFDYQGYAGALAGINPMQALQLQQALRKEQPQPIKLGQGEKLLDPATYKQLADNPKSEKPAAAIEEYNFAKQQGYPGTFQQWVTEKARAGASSTTVSYGAPVAGVDEQGKPIFFQPSKDGRPPSIVQGVAPPKVDKPMPEAAQKQLVGTRNLQDAVDGYVKALGGWSNAKMLIPDERAKMGSAYNNMMLQAKEAYNLGVLNGPDYQILQSVVKDPTKPGSAFTSNAAMATQAKELSRIAKSIEGRVLEAHGKTAPDTTQKPNVLRFDAQGNPLP